MSDVFSTQFERLLHDKIKKCADDERYNISVGAAQDFAAYKNRVGIVEGLNLALSMFEETRRELHGDDPKDKKK